MDKLYGQEEHEITNKEKEEYQRQKRKKRTQKILNDDEVIKFAELLARNATSFEFEKDLELSVLDLEFQKRKLGINDMFEAQDFLRSLKSSKNVLVKDEKKMETNIEKCETKVTEVPVREKYNSITHYESVTGKRFRLTKDQMKLVDGKPAKERKAIREKIFREMYGD